MNQSSILYKIKSLLIGVAVGDALGVPVEFKSREYLKENPIPDMIGYGTYNIPQNWLQQLARKNQIEDLAERMAKNIVPF